jgi:hypothetical protein
MPFDSERAFSRSAPGVDRMKANQPGARMGSRPKPPQAGARSARLEPGRSPGYPSFSQLLTLPSLREGPLPLPLGGGLGIQFLLLSGVQFYL